MLDYWYTKPEIFTKACNIHQYDHSCGIDTKLAGPKFHDCIENTHVVDENALLMLSCELASSAESEQGS